MVATQVKVWMKNARFTRVRAIHGMLYSGKITATGEVFKILILDNSTEHYLQKISDWQQNIANGMYTDLPVNRFDVVDIYRYDYSVHYHHNPITYYKTIGVVQVGTTKAEQASELMPTGAIGRRHPGTVGGGTTYELYRSKY